MPLVNSLCRAIPHITVQKIDATNNPVRFLIVTELMKEWNKKGVKQPAVHRSSRNRYLTAAAWKRWNDNSL